MKYEKPRLKEIVVSVEVKTNADNQTSCAGGHCARARYGNDHKI